VQYKIVKILPILLVFLAGPQLTRLVHAKGEIVEAVVEIAKPEIYRQVVAISDLHGRLKPTRKLIEALGIASTEGKWTGGKTLLVVIGDSVAKGKKSIGLLRYWMDLEAQAKAHGGRLIHTLGNHEARLIADPNSYLNEHPEIVREMEKKELKNISTATREGKFLRRMPIAARVGNVLFIHSGTVEHNNWDELKRDYQKVFEAKNYQHDLIAGKKSVLEIKMWGDEDQKIISKNFQRLEEMKIHTVVFGHEPGIFLDDITKRTTALTHGNQVAINIDFGMGGTSPSNKARAIVFKDPKGMTKSKLDRSHIRTTTKKAIDAYLEDPDFCMDEFLRALFYSRG